MTKNNSDQFAKQLLEEVLAPFGTVETSHEVSGEPQWVDVFFVPAHPSLTSELGLLGRIAQQSCLIEPFRNQPTDDEVRSCLLKLFQVTVIFCGSQDVKKSLFRRIIYLFSGFRLLLLQKDCCKNLERSLMRTGHQEFIFYHLV